MEIEYLKGLEDFITRLDSKFKNLYVPSNENILGYIDHRVDNNGAIQEWGNHKETYYNREFVCDIIYSWLKEYLPDTFVTGEYSIDINNTPKYINDNNYHIVDVKGQVNSLENTIDYKMMLRYTGIPIYDDWMLELLGFSNLSIKKQITFIFDLVIRYIQEYCRTMNNVIATLTRGDGDIYLLSIFLQSINDTKRNDFLASGAYDVADLFKNPIEDRFKRLAELARNRGDGEEKLILDLKESLNFFKSKLNRSSEPWHFCVAISKPYILDYVVNADFSREEFYTGLNTFAMDSIRYCTEISPKLVGGIDNINVRDYPWETWKVPLANSGIVHTINDSSSPIARFPYTTFEMSLSPSEMLGIYLDITTKDVIGTTEKNLTYLGDVYEIDPKEFLNV